ncbi:Isopropylmalate dehydrogenase-like domain-containing protein [Fusarium solani]|uniref:Isopropylmalate dehydrogenase-like domain-containing protein n=1 Tax=Fusarium solani TaxID=169388 RepID=A0A9P9G4W8_FUSSL|nr:Isopropylmalate dehydrogenase-like domain-containing protein [Fusarium solani]KAH7231459.1 Isopropylmalate dehydrogenase-like domain-containing protein [Fusarium solani]
MSEPRTFKIALLPGDGNGPDLVPRAQEVLKAIEAAHGFISFSVSVLPFGSSAIDMGLEALPDDTLQTCHESDAIIVFCLGGGPKASEQGFLRLRKELAVDANIRSVRFPSSHLLSLSSFRPECVEGLDLTFVRDLTGGVYFGARQEADEEHPLAFDTTEYTADRIRKLAFWTGYYAMRSFPPKPVVSIDKFNVMATSRLWRRTVTDVFQEHFPEVPLRHILVDHVAEILSRDPTSLNGLLLTENLFGDILSDQAGAIIGNCNVLASSALAIGRERSGGVVQGMYEPLNLKVGGNPSGNPIPIIEIIKQMLELGFGLKKEAKCVEEALRQTLDPSDLGGANVQMKDLGGTSVVV